MASLVPPGKPPEEFRVSGIKAELQIRCEASGIPIRSESSTSTTQPIGPKYPKFPCIHCFGGLA